MRIMKRPSERVVAALFTPSYYLGLLRVGKVFRKPAHFYYSYLSFRGTFPTKYRVRTPIGEQTLNLFHPADLLTANEIFGRSDYSCSKNDKTIVDIGANIGLATLYFLTRSLDSFVYAFEPVPLNVQGFRRNVRGFEGRYVLAQQAVAVRAGTFEFEIEPSGRLGGLVTESRERSVSDRNNREFIKVSALEVNKVLKAIIDKAGQIDLLKIDVEGTEAELLEAIAPEIRSKVKIMHIESTFIDNPVADTHVFKQRGSIATFRRNLPSSG